MPKLPTFTEGLALIRNAELQRLKTSYQTKKEEYLKLQQLEQNLVNSKQQEYQATTAEKYFQELSQKIEATLEYCEEQTKKHLPNTHEVTKLGESSNTHFDQELG